MILLEKAQKAILDEKLSGWLFYNFAHRDPLADKILAVSPLSTNSRPWIYLLYAEQEAVKIVHRIEESILDHLPGKKLIYGNRESFLSLLKNCAQDTPKVALHYSKDYPRLSFTDYGTARLIIGAGFKIKPAHNLIQRVLSTLSQAEIELHERAAAALYDIIHDIWERIKAHFLDDRLPLYEGDIHQWIRELFRRKKLVTNSPLIVGTGKNTALPHYFPHGKGAQLKNSQLVQLDIWGKIDTADGIYADISWVGIGASSVPAEFKKIFDTIADARDSAVEYIAQKLKAGRPVSGAAVDMHAESILMKAGYGDHIKHRTGHAIDSSVHGLGVNIDAKEFPDTRHIGEGSCFSIEPGLYFSDFGMRTEIDVYIKGNKPVISGNTPQNSILTL
jgi:Xaa-Pro dipeptidase